MKRFKLPNGFGTVYKLPGRRRRPYVAKITVAGKQKPIGYTERYEQGLELLIRNNGNPALLGSSEMTFERIFSLMTEKKFPGVSKSTKASDTNSFKHSKTLWKKPFTQIKLADLQAVIDRVEKKRIGYSTQKKIRNLFHQLYSYAMQYDIVQKDYSAFVQIAKDDKHRKKMPFNTRQLNKVRATLKANDFAEIILIGCYTGLRASELLNLRAADVKLRQKYLIVTKSKTRAGTGRVIPLHKSIFPFVERRIKQGYDYIVSGDKKLSYGKFRGQFVNYMGEMHLKHTSHEMRHTMATMLNNAGANDFSTKCILGHAGKGITQKFYTHKNLHELRKAINLLK